MCATLPSWDRGRCTAYAFLRDPVQAGFLPTSLAGIARRACLQPGAQLDVTASQRASRQLQVYILDTLQEIADRASDDFSAHVRKLPPAEAVLLYQAFELPPTVRARWSPPDASSTRRNRVYSLRMASTLAGVQVPSVADQQMLHALAALYAKALFFDFLASFITSLNSASQHRCRLAVDVTSSLEAHTFEMLLPFLRNRSTDPPALDTGPLMYALLNMTNSTFRHLQDHVNRHGVAVFPLLHPVDVDHDDYYEDEDDRTLGSTTGDRRRAKTFIGDNARDRNGENDAGLRRPLPRSIFDQAWKTFALAEAQKWGKMRTGPTKQPSRSDSSSSSTQASCPSRPAWLQCLADSLPWSSQSWWFGDLDATARRLATQAVWAFWQTGASPDWYTYDRPSNRGRGARNAGSQRRDVEEERVSSQETEDGEEGKEQIGAGPLYLQDMDHVFSWGLNSCDDL
ncbi:hypothetical protein CERZMDRAFT_101872 [Cercospora zeae-maydis SCOH1-5]|uniref:Uncharacterized protein n=1 Tax=Cercospora zeae-maydis SCOH1-5 TaxID=717836 RepID=A0A6A6F252_9PEZI|nr:hypothetical protein CERZMDRAFT_101872 [Cercospora zeae-maydis SCOH1-5]